MNLHQPLTPWRAGGASVRGRAHARDGRPNQDAWHCRPPADGNAVVALADGHGAPAHFRSDRGARIAVESAGDMLSRFQGDAGALPALLLGEWRQRVFADIARDPLAGDAALPGAALAPYGSTLLAAAITDDELTVAQIGDGDLLLVSTDGIVSRPLASDVGLVGEQTYSLCQDDAERHFRTASMWRTAGAPWPAAVVLASDGVGKSFRDDAALLPAIAALARHAAAAWGDFLADLPGWLGALSDAGSGDDATLAMLLVNDAEGRAR